VKPGALQSQGPREPMKFIKRIGNQVAPLASPPSYSNIINVDRHGPLPH
jgi:hypothetical protein